jgi:putative ABC transport system permease protein
MPIWQEIRYALRGFRANPAFACAVVAILAVGIGATTAVFSVVDRVLFRSLPYAAPGRLVSVGIRIPWMDYDFLPADSYQALRRDPGLLDAVTSWSGIADCDWTGDRPSRLRCARVEASFLPVLGVSPALGRNFSAEEDQPGAPRVALISNALWNTRFGGDRAVLGRRIELDGQVVQVVGVLPADFELPAMDTADLLLPQLLPPAGARPLRVYGRLRTAVSASQFHDAIMARAESFFTGVPPNIRTQLQFMVLPLETVKSGEYRPAAWTLLAAVLATLWIACANTANLLLARSIARRRELAIRVALGASRIRMASQALTEGLLLSLFGGTAGCLLAYGLLRLFIRIAPEGIPPLSAASLDLRVLLFGLAASLVCGVVFGLAPAFYAPKLELLGGTRTIGRMGVAARRLLVGAQIAVSLVLMTCAGIFLQSLWNRQAISLGLRTDHVVTAQFVLGPRYAPPAARQAFYSQLEARIARLPGVESAALSDSLPPGGTPRSQPLFALTVEGRPPLEQGAPGIVVWRAVTPEYFRTLGIPILRGRPFTEDDRRPTEWPIIISASYARRLFGEESPLGRRMSRFPGSPRNPTIWYTIVGVAADARNSGLTDRNDAEYYLVRRRGSESSDDIPMNSAIIVRGSATPAAIRSELAALDPALPLVIRSFDQHLGQLAARPRFQAWLLALFAAIGLLLAAFGLYGLVAFLVAQREREFGVRLALGATPVAILRLVLTDALRWTVAGLTIGLLGSIAAARALRSLLFHVSPTDPTVYIVAAAVLISVALTAALVPSRRAAQVDPATALRAD